MKDNENLLKQALKASLEAGREILEVYADKDFDIRVKKDDSPLTAADEKAHKKIVSYLNDTGIPVLSEEGKNIPYEIRKNWDIFWLVDPLDGTKEFIKRNGEFTVNIALISDKKPVMGIIYVPVLKTLYFAEENIGAFLKNNIKGLDKEITNTNNLLNSCFKLPLQKENDKYTVVGSRSHMSEKTEEFINTIKQERGEIEMISVGSSLKFCMLPEGKADIYPRFGPTMEWDTAAGHAIAEISGFTVTQPDGKPLEYNKENLLNPWFIVRKA